MDYNDHTAVTDALQKAIDADRDNRERGRDSQRFMAARDGQWEPEWAARAHNKPQYTFDMVEAIVDQIMGDIDKSDFDTRTIPVGGEASEDTAETFNGLLRSIKASSSARRKYRAAMKNAVISGFDAVRVIQSYADGDSFDQELMIESIPNAIERVFFGHHTEPDASDARHCWILSAISRDEYTRRFKDRAEASVDAGLQSQAFFHKNDLTVVGEFLYLEPVPRTLVKMTNGAVYVDDERFQSIVDELALGGVTEKERRTRSVLCCYSRRFDASGWIDKAPRKTVFKHWLPVVPIYGNFMVIEDKVVYWGAVEKLMDPQRVLNYSLSREIEEGALAPRSKYWMTRKQAEGEAKTLSTLNTNTDPVQFYTPDPDAPGAPQQQGGAQINPGLRNISQAMQEIIGVAAGMFAANMGDNPGLQSGVAIEALQDRGDRANNKYLKARETFERQVARILIKAIPAIYEPDRQIRLLSQDGSVEVSTIGKVIQDRVLDSAGQQVIDPQTGAPISREVVLHDVSRGSYEVEVTASPSFQTRQSETVRAITDIAKADPSIIAIGADILLANVPAPGMDELAARKRLELFNAGLIPVDQMTLEERDAWERLQQEPQQESPEMVLARAEQAKAEAEKAKAEADFLTEQNRARKQEQDYQLGVMKETREQARLRLDAFIAESNASKTGMETRKIYADVVEILARAEKMEAETDATVTRITDVLGGAA